MSIQKTELTGVKKKKKSRLNLIGTTFPKGHAILFFKHKNKDIKTAQKAFIHIEMSDYDCLQS